MRLTIDEPADVVAQMQRDHERWELAQSCEPGETELRLYRFDPAGITLGTSQVPEHELDLGRCERDGVAWAVRPTGGRALFHADEWTFTLLAPLGPSGYAFDARSAYARTCTMLAAALQWLGVPVRLAAGSARGVGAPRAPGGAAPPCFASTARHELLLDGRKFAGVAQRVSRGRVLQQGSLLLGRGHERLADYLAMPDERREPTRRALLAASAEAGPWLAAQQALPRLAAAITAVTDAPVRPVVTAPVDGAFSIARTPGILSP